MDMNVLVFDIETIPDVDAGRKLYGFEGDAAAVATAMFAKRMEESGHEFLRHYLHRIIVISVVLRQENKFKVCSIGDEDAGEADLIQRFYNYIKRYTPTLVSWNGSGFDLPVLHYRSLLHGVSAPHYWEKGDHDQAFKWNNYLNRYHDRHTDLMDVLAAYSGQANAPLDEIAKLLGFPGKMGMSGAETWKAYLAGKQAAIRDYCETDALNTFLVYLRFMLLQGKLSRENYQREFQLVLDSLQTSNKAHLQSFAAACNNTLPPLKK